MASIVIRAKTAQIFFHQMSISQSAMRKLFPLLYAVLRHFDNRSDHMEKLLNQSSVVMLPCWSMEGQRVCEAGPDRLRNSRLCRSLFLLSTITSIDSRDTV